MPSNWAAPHPMRPSLYSLLVLAIAASLRAEAPLPLPPPARVIPLYPAAAPGSEKWNWPERFVRLSGLDFVQNVVRPVLQYFPADPAKACGTAVIIAPGGGSVNLTMRYEGTDVARRLNEAGIAAFVLKYRLIQHDPVTGHYYPKDDKGVILAGPQRGQNIWEMEGDDGRQAVRWVRTHSSEFGCSPHRIGFIGFSAGGGVVLASVVGPAATRPDFFAPIYGAGDGAILPPPDAPPMFLAVAADDLGNTVGSMRLFNSWRSADRPAELHIFQTGGHGFLKRGGGGDHVIERLIDWMRSNGLLTRQ